MNRPHRTFDGIMSIASFDRPRKTETETENTDTTEVNNE
jgi:hypothetical protein